MKKYFLLLTILFSSSLFSQLITYTSVRLDEGQNEDYIKIEDFWSKIHEATIAQDLATGWMIWEVIKEEGDEKASSRPDFLIMNFYKDSIQKISLEIFMKLEELHIQSCQRRNLIKFGRVVHTEKEISMN